MFLKQLWQGISGEKNSTYAVVSRKYSEIISESLNHVKPQSRNEGSWFKRTFKAIGKWFYQNRKLLLTSLGIFFATVAAFLLYKYVQAQASIAPPATPAIFWRSAFLSYCKNIATILLFPVLIGLFKSLLDTYHAKDSKKIELNFPIESTDDYELFLENTIKSRLTENENFRVITIIDDLDRLSINKIVEALDALKAFVGFERCVFIVPFDDEIIKRALEKLRIKQFDEMGDTIESELILDKLFQFKVYLPPLPQLDISQYAGKLVQQEIPDFLAEYCSLNAMETLLNRIIIHSSVTTPRQVKKLINAFVNNYMVACQRERAGNVEKGLFTSLSGMEQVAKFSVLQADFNRFYDILFYDFSFLDKFSQCQEKQELFSKVPKPLRGYYTYVGTEKENNLRVSGVKEEHEPLANFIKRTQKFYVANIEPYLRLAQDEISRKTGDETQRRAINALESGNTTTLRSLLDEKPALAEAVSVYLSYTNDDIEDALLSAIEVYDIILEEEKKRLAAHISERTLELEHEKTKMLYGAPPTTVLDIANYSENFGKQFFELYLHTLSNPEWLDAEKIIIALKTIINVWQDLNESERVYVQQIANLCISSENVDASALLEIIDYDNEPQYMILWGKAWYEKLCLYVDKENDFSKRLKDGLRRSFSILSEDTTISADELCMALLPLSAYSALIDVLNDIMQPEVCDRISNETATSIADNIIQLYSDDYKNIIYKLLVKLPFVINEENAEAYNSFTLNYKTDAEMDDVLLYCGKQGYFSHLDTTITELLDDVFEDDANDGLLSKVQDSFTEEQRSVLFSKLTEVSSFTSAGTYERATAVYSIVAKCAKNANLIDDLVSTTSIDTI